MRAFGDVMSEMSLVADEKTTPRQREIIKDMVDVAHAWARGEIPLDTARELTLDGWLRMKISLRMLGDSEDAQVWQSFIAALDDRLKSDCDYGAYDAKGVFISKVQIVALGGWVEKEYDAESGELRCVARFPHVNLERPPKLAATAQPASMAEWFE